MFGQEVFEEVLGAGRLLQEELLLTKEAGGGLEGVPAGALPP